MLVLSRKRGEKIHIGNNVRLSIEDIRPDRVRIGIEAPREIPIYRGEVFQVICQAGTSVPSLTVISGCSET